MNRSPDLYLTDERLKEWAWWFRDRRSSDRCRSIESRYRRSSEDADPDGWGDIETSPKTQPARSYNVLRAEKTEDSIRQLERIYRWALTYAYCYPYLPRHVTLRCMKKYAGRRLNWGKYTEVLEIGVMRLHTVMGIRA